MCVFLCVVEGGRTSYNGGPCNISQVHSRPRPAKRSIVDVWQGSKYLLGYSVARGRSGYGRKVRTDNLIILGET